MGKLAKQLIKGKYMTPKEAHQYEREANKKMAEVNRYSAIVVVAVCNCDDVFCGVFPPVADGIKRAKAKARAIAKNPDLRFQNAGQPADTGFVFSRVLRLDGEDTPIEIATFDPSNARKRKAK